jgi:phosphomannomutase
LSVVVEAILKNNNYIIQLLSKVLEIKSIKDKNIIIWPYLGKARGIVDLFTYYGANITLIEEEINPPNPIKVIREEKLQEVMAKVDSNIALLLDADRDRIALYIKQNGEYFTYIPNEIYSAMHNILAKDFGKKIINVRTIPSDLRGDHTSFINILTGVGYKHLGAILYFLMSVEVEQSKIDTAILYMEDEDKTLIKINKPAPLRKQIISLMEKEGIEEESFIIVMWEESGGHTIDILEVTKEKETGNYQFKSPYPLIADKYPVPALVVITELICRGYVISEAIDWSIVGINRTIPATDEEKVKIMKNFELNDGQQIQIQGKDYTIKALSDNNDLIDIYQLKSENSTLYFRPSGTGPDVRFYVFGKRETHLDEIKTVQDYVKDKYL